MGSSFIWCAQDTKGLYPPPPPPIRLLGHGKPSPLYLLKQEINNLESSEVLHGLVLTINRVLYDFSVRFGVFLLRKVSVKEYLPTV